MLVLSCVCVIQSTAGQGCENNHICNILRSVQYDKVHLFDRCDVDNNVNKRLQQSTGVGTILYLPLHLNSKCDSDRTSMYVTCPHFQA